MADWKVIGNKNTIDPPAIGDINIMGVDINVEEQQQKSLKKAENAEEALQIIQTKEFADTLRSYYKYRDGDSELTMRGINTFDDMSHADLLEFFYNDRAWRNNNTIAMGKDMANALAEEDAERLKEFAFIQQTYAMLPSFWNDPNRSFGAWLLDSGGAFIIDPVNLVGFGIGGQAAKQAYKEALKQGLKGKIAKEINQRVLIESQKQAQKKAMGQAIKKGALYEGFIGGSIAGAQDAMLQTTAINTGVQDEFSLKQLGLHTGAGFGFGTLFGAGFTYGGFKLTNRQMKNTAIKNLEDLHNYGRDTITGKRLFTDLSEKKTKKFKYKNLKKEEIDQIEQRSILQGKDIDAKIKNLRDVIDTGSVKGKPPKEKFNYEKMNKDGQIGAVKYIKNVAREMSEDIGTEKITREQMILVAEKLGLDPKKLQKLAKSKAKEDREVFGLVIAHGDLMIKQADDIVKLSNELNRVGITPKEETAIVNELTKREQVVFELMQVQKSLQENYARATSAGNVIKNKDRAKALLLQPEDPTMIKLKRDDPKAFYKAVSLLDDDNQVILALQNARKVDKWDLAAEYVNNNLLSSPDTHLLNIISGLTQTQWKPFVMLLRSANMLRTDTNRAGVIAREALQTYVYQYAYTGYALKRALKAFYMGRPLLDSTQLKWDSNIRQGQLQRFINETGKLLTDPLGVIGKPIQKAVNVAAYATSFPLRILSAGDEFLKQMTFKARMAAQVNSQVLRANPELGGGIKGLLPTIKNRVEYKKAFREAEAKYTNTSGQAISTQEMSGAPKLSDADRMEINDPLQYAREASYTQAAYSVNPKTGKKEGKLTGKLLEITQDLKWLRVAGMHFINTPSNLLRWNAQHLPFLGRFQFQMRHMLAKGKDGKFLNPEAAAEANARIQAGWLLWTAAIFTAIQKKTTGGGSRDWKENRERENTTGWQPYSYVTDDGRHVSVNRLDPIMMPFMIAADFVDAMEDFYKHNDDFPTEVENQYTELAMGVVASLTRNVSSKFYTKNILETANFFFSDDFMKARAPDRIGSSILARAIYKITPLSGGLRYGSRVTDDAQRELFTLNDRLRTLNPFSDKDRTMPRRNIFGEKIDRKNGWLFGLGGRTGVFSSPFAMTTWNNNATAQFFKDREFNYKPPQKTDEKTGIDLRTIKDSNGQTAYDYMLEQKGNVTFQYKGKKLKLKAYIEALVGDPTSKLYRLPDGLVAGDDYRQKVILRIVHGAEKKAYAQMYRKFPILKETLKAKGLFVKDKITEAKSDFFDILGID
ncbi:internal virion protein D [Pelagibacter phage HTVC109P]|nr:internal virion protein D [Pelagibacter phage HTVC109P]